MGGFRIAIKGEVLCTTEWAEIAAVMAVQGGKVVPVVADG